MHYLCMCGLLLLAVARQSEGQCIKCYPITHWGKANVDCHVHKHQNGESAQEADTTTDTKNCSNPSLMLKMCFILWLH